MKHVTCYLALQFYENSILTNQYLHFIQVLYKSFNDKSNNLH